MYFCKECLRNLSNNPCINFIKDYFANASWHFTKNYSKIFFKNFSSNTLQDLPQNFSKGFSRYFVRFNSSKDFHQKFTKNSSRVYCMSISMNSSKHSIRNPFKHILMISCIGSFRNVFFLGYCQDSSNIKSTNSSSNILQKLFRGFFLEFL